jgi:hypothetical protein
MLISILTALDRPVNRGGVLTSFARSHVCPYDPEGPTSLKRHRNSKHRVTLETLGRQRKSISA